MPDTAQAPAQPEVSAAPLPIAAPAAPTDGEDASADRPLWAYPATYALMAVNFAVYAVMYRSGPVPQILGNAVPRPSHDGWRIVLLWIAGLFSAPFSAHVLQHFGACSPEQILASGQWWRVVTSPFVHVTLLHLLINMWCLWNLGVFGEPLLGRPGLIAVYLLTGAAGMLQSVGGSLFRGDLTVITAGASGAVFGLAGILIILLSNRKLETPLRELRFLRLQVIFFALINLLLGSLPVTLPRFVPGLWRAMHIPPGSLPEIDNGAHLGGLLSGLLLGLLLFPRMTSGRSSYRVRQAIVFSSAAMLLVLVGYGLASYAHGPTS